MTRIALLLLLILAAIPVQTVALGRQAIIDLEAAAAN
jgi:hypothetical protein